MECRLPPVPAALVPVPWGLGSIVPELGSIVPDAEHVTYRAFVPLNVATLILRFWTIPLLTTF
eukprot:271449-Prymnesium_polylepis.2